MMMMITKDIYKVTHFLSNHLNVHNFLRNIISLETRVLVDIIFAKRADLKVQLYHCDGDRCRLITDMSL